MNDSPVSRRDFTRNVARYGLIGALGLFLGLRNSNTADAGSCYWSTQYTECRPSSSCGGYSTWAFQKQVCCTPGGCSYSGYARWVRLYCGC